MYMYVNKHLHLHQAVYNLLPIHLSSTQNIATDKAIGHALFWKSQTHSVNGSIWLWTSISGNSSENCIMGMLLTGPIDKKSCLPKLHYLTCPGVSLLIFLSLFSSAVNFFFFFFDDSFVGSLAWRPRYLRGGGLKSLSSSEDARFCAKSFIAKALSNSSVAVPSLPSEKTTNHYPVQQLGRP